MPLGYRCSIIFEPYDPELVLPAPSGVNKVVHIEPTGWYGDFIPTVHDLRTYITCPDA